MAESGTVLVVRASKGGTKSYGGAPLAACVTMADGDGYGHAAWGQDEEDVRAERQVSAPLRAIFATACYRLWTLRLTRTTRPSVRGSEGRHGFPYRRRADDADACCSGQAARLAGRDTFPRA